MMARTTSAPRECCQCGFCRWKKVCRR